MKIHLIQPRHIYAPKDGLGHLYMPTSLIAAGSILLKMGAQVIISDENDSDIGAFKSNVVGINILGSPYISIAQEFDNKLRKEYGDNYKLLVGGQIINGFTNDQFSFLFSKNVINGNSKEALAELFNVSIESVPSIEHLSLIDAYKLVPEESFKNYLKSEFSFYLSQGCKHSCSFCSAHRTIVNSENKVSFRSIESYRNIDQAIIDLEFLFENATRFKICDLSIYLSNLDLFQRPKELKKFVDRLSILSSKFSHLNLSIRGLSTCRSFLTAHRKYPEVLEKFAQLGLSQIGFGVDGATPEVYFATRKPQKDIDESLEAIQVCKSVYDVTPETLMVFGHNHKEDENSLIKAYEFCKDMQKKYGALPRPHIAKDIVPGNDGWNNPSNSEVINKLLHNPRLFQHLDFTAAPSELTHPDNEFREIVNEYYKKVCELPGSLTQYVLPEKMDSNNLDGIIAFNEGKYDI